MTRIPLPILVLAWVPGLLQAEDPLQRAPVEPNSLPAPDQAVAPAKPAIEKLDNGRLRLGEITFDPTARTIRFPAQVNMTEGLLEYLIVHKNGKTHESLLSTGISPTQLNVVFKLLHYPASRELYNKLNEDGTLTNEFETATDKEKAGARLRLGVEWADGTKNASLNGWITHAVTEKPMPEDPWVYGGSYIHHGGFAAEGSGDVAAIFLSNAALINYSGKDNELDEVWLPHPTRVPEIGTKVTVVIAPFETEEKSEP